MRRIVLILMLLSSPLLAAFGPAPDVDVESQSPYIYRIEVSDCPGGRWEQLTGFRISGKAGFYTALHGVAGCRSFSAYPVEGKGRPYADLQISEVDIAHDVALLSGDPIAQESTLPGFTAATLKDIKTDADYVIIGYRQGLSDRQSHIPSNVLSRAVLGDMVPKEERQRLRTRASPALENTVYHLRAGITHGMSGAPVLLRGEQVVAIANGGLDDGDKDFTWAIPWADIRMRPLRAAQAEYDKLAGLGTAAFAFSSGEPQTQLKQVRPKAVTAANVRSYRAQSTLYVGAMQGATYMENLVQVDAVYAGNRQLLSMSMEESIPGEGAQANLNRTGVTATIIDGQQYTQLAGSNCAVPGVASAELDNLQQAFYAALTAPVGSDSFTASYLGPDEVNGVTADHYMLADSRPANERQASVALQQVSTGEFWLSHDGLLIKANVVGSAEYTPADEEPVTAVAVFAIDITNINETFSIPQPVTCAGASAPRSAAPAGRVSARLEQYSVAHNVDVDGQAGMSVRLTFTTQTTAGRPGVAAFGIYTEDGAPLVAADSRYRAGDGSLVSAVIYKPKLADTRFTELAISIPYEALDLVEGFHTLQVLPYLVDPATGEVLDTAGEASYFSVVYHADAALPWIGLEGLRSAGAKAIVGFVSAASRAEMDAYYYRDASYVTPYYAGNALQMVEDGVAALIEKGLYVDAQFDPERSYILKIDVPAQDMWAVTYCEYWVQTVYDALTDKAVETYPLAAAPQTLQFESIGGRTYITDAEAHDNLNLCAAP